MILLNKSIIYNLRKHTLSSSRLGNSFLADKVVWKTISSNITNGMFYKCFPMDEVFYIQTNIRRRLK